VTCFTPLDDFAAEAGARRCSPNSQFRGRVPIFVPCVPTSGKAVPATPTWLHEVKDDLPPAKRTSSS